MRIHRFLALYRHHFRDRRRERMFLASLSFFVTFALTRAMVHAARAQGVGFELEIGGIHVHHLVWGIVLLLVSGYLWILQLEASDDGGPSLGLGRLTATLYGIGAALTLDEFALWLNLRDVYWEREGRASIDVVFLYGALVSAGVWGGPFLRAVGRQFRRVIRRYVPPPQLLPTGEPELPAPEPQPSAVTVAVPGPEERAP